MVARWGAENQNKLAREAQAAFADACVEHPELHP